MTKRLWRRVGRKTASMRWLLIALAATAIVLVCVLVIPQWLLRWDGIRVLTPAAKAKVINDVRATLLQGVGGAALLLGAFFTYWQLQTGRDQLHVAQEGQVTERFTRAIDQLGHEDTHADLLTRPNGFDWQSAGVRNGTSPSLGLEAQPNCAEGWPDRIRVDTLHNFEGL